jgi:hypothetical protein
MEPMQDGTGTAISDEAVEVAVAAVYGEGDLPQKLGEFGAEVRMILEAAAPHLLARAWSEGYSAGEIDGAYGLNGHEDPDQRNPYRK